MSPELNVSAPGDPVLSYPTHTLQYWFSLDFVPGKE